MSTEVILTHRSDRGVWRGTIRLDNNEIVLQAINEANNNFYDGVLELLCSASTISRAVLEIPSPRLGNGIGNLRIKRGNTTTEAEIISTADTQDLLADLETAKFNKITPMTTLYHLFNIGASLASVLDKPKDEQVNWFVCNRSKALGTAILME